MNRKVPLRRSRMRAAGKRVKRWAAVRRAIKPIFAAMGIVTCELRLEGCWHDNALSFAHFAKRRKLSNEDLKVVILSCTPCHQTIEVLPADEMREIVLRVISKRMVTV